MRIVLVCSVLVDHLRGDCRRLLPSNCPKIARVQAKCYALRFRNLVLICGRSREQPGRIDDLLQVTTPQRVAANSWHSLKLSAAFKHRI